MAKKITGKSKLLERQNPVTPKTEPLNLVKPQKQKAVLKNYRLTPNEIANLQQIVTAVNGLCPYKNISENKIIKALIFIGSQTQPAKIAKAVKEVS